MADLSKNLALPQPQLEPKARLAVDELAKVGTVAVLGSHGGAGCTTLSVNLACTLALASSNRVALVDLDLCLGDVDIWLDLVPLHTLADVVTDSDQLDLPRLERILERHEPTNLRVLLHPSQIEDSGKVEARHLRQVFGLLRSAYTHVVLDVGRVGKTLTAVDLAALQLVDAVLLVFHLDIGGLRNAIRLLSYLERHEGLARKTLIVVNRLDESAGIAAGEISLAKAKQVLGKPVFAMLPDDVQGVCAARAAGSPLALHSPDSPVQRELTKLTRRLFAGSSTK